MGKGRGERGIPWTPERIERVAEMWRDGSTASEIAGELGGITRNAVIGKLNRLGLRRGLMPSAPKKAAPSKARVAARPAAPKKAAKPKPKAKPAAAAPLPAPPPKPKRRPSPPIGKFTILDLHDAVCSFPLADYHARPPYLFCGAPRFAGAYCETHARRCYPALARGP